MPRPSNTLFSSETKPLAGRTLLIAPSGNSQFASELESDGARVIQCGSVEIIEPESYAPLDDAIENLFGYDWLIFANVNAIDSFLHRFEALGKEISELASLRVCALGEAVASELGELRVHIDLISSSLTTAEILPEIEQYLGGRDSLRGQNFLIPDASSRFTDLSLALEDAGARADIVPAYRTVLSGSSDLARINALLTGGGIDCIVFLCASAVEEFAQLFDINDLSRLLKGVAVACVDDSAAMAAAALGLRADIKPHGCPTHFSTEAIAEFLK